ncbi:hypothetical protein AAC387_Pa02g0856 [Persea americana]
MPLLHLPPHGEGSETNLQDEIDDNTGRPFIPYISSRNTFLFPVITPIYDAVKAEVAPPLTPPAELRRHQRVLLETPLLRPPPMAHGAQLQFLHHRKDGLRREELVLERLPHL